jgi:energy-converting hydrogenase B subunit D
MIVELNFFLLLFAVITAVAALEVRDLLSAVVLLSAFSFFMCLVWAEMGAVDVAFTEAAVGAGVSTAFFIAALYHTKRRSKD